MLLISAVSALSSFLGHLLPSTLLFKYSKNVNRFVCFSRNKLLYPKIKKKR